MIPSRSTIGGGRGCHKFVLVLGGNGTKIAPHEDLFDQPPGEISSILGKLADHHVGDHVVLSTEGVVLLASWGTESSYPRLPQPLKPSTGDNRTTCSHGTCYVEEGNAAVRSFASILSLSMYGGICYPPSDIDPGSKRLRF